MKQRFQRVDPDVFDLAWFDDEELEALQRAMIQTVRMRFARIGCAR
jgi:hypothetical protein